MTTAAVGQLLIQRNASGPVGFLRNPRGLHWSEVGQDDIVLVDAQGNRLAGRHRWSPPRSFIHAAVHRIAGKVCVMHTHMPHATTSRS